MQLKFDLFLVIRLKMILNHKAQDIVPLQFDTMRLHIAEWIKCFLSMGAFEFIITPGLYQ